MEYQIESKLADGQWVADGIGVENYPRSYGECEADIALLREIGGEFAGIECRIVEVR